MLCTYVEYSRVDNILVSIFHGNVKAVEFSGDISSSHICSILHQRNGSIWVSTPASKKEWCFLCTNVGDIQHKTMEYTSYILVIQYVTISK